MKIKMIPTILMLFAAAITSIICFILNYEVRSMLIALLVVMAFFYFVGDIVRYFLKKYVFPEKVKEEKKEEETVEGENSDAEKAVLKEDSLVKEKVGV